MCANWLCMLISDYTERPARHENGLGCFLVRAGDRTARPMVLHGTVRLGDAKPPFRRVVRPPDNSDLAKDSG